jgi:hypothetical protein
MRGIKRRTNRQNPRRQPKVAEPLAESAQLVVPTTSLVIPSLATPSNDVRIAVHTENVSR